MQLSTSTTLRFRAPTRLPGGVHSLHHHRHQHRQPVPACRATETATGPSERVLRYPDGYERRIRYPDNYEPASSSAASTMSQEDVDIYDVEAQEYLTWDECQLWGAACLSSSSLYYAPPATPAPAVVEEDATDTWLEELSKLANAQPKDDINTLVKASYQVYNSSPWVLPRPLYVLAVLNKDSSSSDTGVGSMYTLRTRVAKQGVQDELAMVLGKQSLASSVSLSAMCDGIVAFDSEEDAERFASLLEADYGMEVVTTPMDSHYLFRSADDARALVVHLPVANYLPLPYQLASALKGAKSWDD